jgi:hypothetical protein
MLMAALWSALAW